MAAIAAFIKDFGPAFAWIIAAVGWALTNRQANNREKRKEFRSEIDAIEETVQAVAKKTASYLRMRTRDKSALLLELEIVVLFQSIDIRCERLARRQTNGELGLYIDKVDTIKEDLYDFATGRYFETPKRIPQDELSARVQGIHTRAFLLVEALHSLFLMKFDKIRSL
ncbi:hypothetical protein IV454_16460 [Massilia antarctica]|uniref:DUF4760 domain-containing protein n=1 Tax=Massilia antarctica TaxID=2765360 RepID=A0AA49AAX1_9BURK|nr:hypothetical protein [Massilia antarctica]QPI52939.1 hypothetical protein IV454_16460 [Massilia antarctica]